MTKEVIRARIQILSNYIYDIESCLQISEQGRLLKIENDVFGTTEIEDDAAFWLKGILSSYKTKYQKKIGESL